MSHYAPEATAETTEEAEHLLNIQKQINPLVEQLDKHKARMRDLANHEKLDISVPGLGKVIVSAPRKGSTSEVEEINLEILDKFPELKAKLKEKKIIITKEVKTSPGVASVTIKLNV